MQITIFLLLKRMSQLSIGGQSALYTRDLAVNLIKSSLAGFSPPLSHCGSFWILILLRTQPFGFYTYDAVISCLSFSSSKYWLKFLSAFVYIPVDRCLLPGGHCSILISIFCVAFFYQLSVIFASSLWFSTRVHQHCWSVAHSLMVL